MVSGENFNQKTRFDPKIGGGIFSPNMQRSFFSSGPGNSDIAQECMAQDPKKPRENEPSERNICFAGFASKRLEKLPSIGLGQVGFSNSYCSFII